MFPKSMVDNGTINNSFHIKGKWPVDIDLVNIRKSGTARLSAQCFRIHTGIASVSTSRDGRCIKGNSAIALDIDNPQ